MPVTRIAIRDGKSGEYKQALLDEIYEAMREPAAGTDLRDCYFGAAPTSREDSTVQVPAAPVVISDAASQKLGTNWLVMNWFRARAWMVMSILFVGTCSRQASG